MASDGGAGAPTISIVPSTVDAATLSRGFASDGLTTLPLGIDFATGGMARLDLPDGEHALVLGGARSGRSTALVRVAAAWQSAHPLGWVGAVLPRRTSAVDTIAHAFAADVSLLDQLPQHTPVLLVIDDAEAVDDAGGRLATLAASGRPGLWIVAAGRPDSLRQMYGHWTTVVRRSRTGLVLTGGSDLDGDLLGVTRPRRTPVPARPGLAWLVTGGPAQLVQVAVDTSDSSAPAVARSTRA
jgi:S-DNA-T family DNA segregation ATPase FtsK/SpoIIIE